MASLFIPKFHQFCDDSGDPLNGGKIYFYTTSTTNLKNTYKEESLTNANTNPVVLDADGRSANEVWISGRYKVVVQTSAGVEISTDDPVEDYVPASDAQDNSPTYGGANTGTSTALAFAFTPTLTTLAAGVILRGRISATASGAVTINCDGLGAKSLVDGTGAAIVYLPGPNIIEFSYDSTTDVFRLQSANTSMGLGKHTIPVPASAMYSRTTNGAAAGLTELGTNDVMLATKDFDQTTSEGVQFYLPMAKSSQETTLTFQAAWTAASGSGTVTWGFRALAVGDDDAMDAAFGTAQTVTDTLLTANDMHVTSVSSAVTPSGTWAEGDTLIVEVYRDISDTLNADAKLIWVKAFVNVIAPTDD